MNNDYEPEAFEEIFIPFLSDEEDEEFRSLQRLWSNKDSFVERIKTAIENEE